MPPSSQQEIATTTPVIKKQRKHRNIQGKLKTITTRGTQIHQQTFKGGGGREDLQPKGLLKRVPCIRGINKKGRFTQICASERNLKGQPAIGSRDAN